MEKDQAKKRILIFSLAHYPLVGGAEIAVKEITDRIDDYAFDMVTLRFNRADAKEERVGNVHVYRIGTGVRFFTPIEKYLFPFFASMKASRLHRKQNYDAIWSIMANYAGFAALFFKMTHSRIPYLLTLQEGDPIETIRRKTRLVRPLFWRIFTKADFVQAISSYLADWARDMGYAGEIAVIPNGVDVDHFSRVPLESERALTQELDKREGEVFLITASRLVEKNAVGDVIRALALLPEHVSFVVLGKGPLESELRQFAGREDVAHRARFLGEVGHDELSAYLAVSDIFIRPSLSEGLGSAFLEAMAARVPVIGTPVGGIPEFLTDYETGRMVSPHSPEEIAEAVRWYLNNSEERNAIANRAYAMVKERYTWDGIAARQREEVFRNLAE